MKQSQANNANKGFTLIEVLLVLAIIGIVGAIATPSILNFRGKSQGTGAAIFSSNVKEQLITAMTQASGSSNCAKEPLLIDAAGNEFFDYAVVGDNPATSTGLATARLQKAFGGRALLGTTVTINTPPGAGARGEYAYGNLGYDMTINSDCTATVTISRASASFVEGYLAKALGSKLADTLDTTTASTKAAGQGPVTVGWADDLVNTDFYVLTHTMLR